MLVIIYSKLLILDVRQKDTKSYRPPLPAGWRWRVADARVGAHELHPGQVQSGPGSGVERSKEKEKITAGIRA